MSLDTYAARHTSDQALRSFIPLSFRRPPGRLPNRLFTNHSDARDANSRWTRSLKKWFSTSFLLCLVRRPSQSFASNPSSQLMS